MKTGERIYSDRTGTTYTVIQVLKSGGQAETAYATSDKGWKIFFIKRLLNIRYTRTSFERCMTFETERQKVYREINMLTLPGGACTYIHDFFREKTFYYVVTEKIDAIKFDVKQLANVMPIEDKLFLFRIIAYSFFPLEKANIIYADVKPENILLKYVGGRYVPKLTDFESAFNINTPPCKGDVVGTEPYYSPELADYNNEHNSVDSSLLSTKSDIFSLGIILYEFLTGEYPVSKESKKYVYEFIRDGGDVRMPHSWSTNLRVLVKRMMSLNPAQRPNVMELLEELKNLTDVSIPLSYITKPAVFIRHENEKRAYVNILSLNKGADIHYNTDNTGWRSYNEPFVINDDDVKLDVKIQLCLKGGRIENRVFQLGDISVSTNRSRKVAHPIINVAGGVVSMTCKNPNAIIHYTLDGTLPNKTSPIYRGKFPVGGNVQIKAYARCVGFLPSDCASRNSNSKINIS